MLISYRLTPVILLASLLAACAGDSGGTSARTTATAISQAAAASPSPAATAQARTAGTPRERDVTVGSGEWALPGTLTLPAGAGPFPALVLVHGSGPNDRDETIGPNKPFRDLAQGLAARGVAVLRYDKRTKVYQSRFTTPSAMFTVKDETVDDALTAVTLLRTMPEVDTKRIFVLGHSLGGYLVPRIGALDADIAGFVVLSGSTRPLEDIIVEQFTYLASLDGQVAEQVRPQLDEIRKQAARVKDPELRADTPAAQLLGAPGAYWLDLRGYQPAEEAKKLQRPMLILQGERDYQVIGLDFQNWHDALASRSDVEFKSYPKANHLLIEGEGKITPDEYAKPGHVAEAVIADIAAWISRH